VFLRSLTELPEGVKFENHGSVFLRSLTELPEGVKFENHGSVDLPSLSGEIVYQNRQFEIQYIDGDAMLLTSKRTIDGYKISKARYFHGGDIVALPQCWIAEKDGFYAHGESIKDAIEDAAFKAMQVSANVEDIAREVKQSGVVTKNQYRLLTGACDEGCRRFISDHGIDSSDPQLPLSKALDFISGHFGYDRFKELIEAA
ncbi:MAG: hypothetical protein AAF236_09875, partial [Verrucomicrobiota bacterium]